MNLFYCSECGESVNLCERCRQPLQPGDTSTCGIWKPGKHFHSHTEPSKCKPLQQDASL